jgi:hypothetical protein
MAKKTDKKPLAETVSIDKLKPHPRNYRTHPEDQLAHIRESIRKNGIYRHVVVADDYTVLAGHGTLQAAKLEGYTEVPVVKLPLKADSPRALKVLTGDNEIGRLVDVDDYNLSQILKEVGDIDGLLGTGFDEMQLANLVMVTRPSSEIEDINEAAHWVGMPKFENVPAPLKLIISFKNEDHRNELLKRLKVKGFAKATGKTLSMWWPQRDREDVKSVAFTASDG